MKGQTDEAVGACAVAIQESVSMATIAILFPFFEQLTRSDNGKGSGIHDPKTVSLILKDDQANL